MRKLYGPLMILGIILLFSSCLKEANKGVSTSFTGKWRIVSDSTTTQFWGLWAGRPNVGSNYAGTASDYYNFTADGKLYTSENNYLDTGTYQKMRLDSIGFSYPRWQLSIKYLVSNHTTHTMTLTSAFPMVTPETAYIHIIKLQK